MNPVIYGLIVTLFGMTIVFLVLIGLWGILATMRPFFGTKRKDEASPKVERNIAASAVENNTHLASDEDLASDELIAVITAAINACMGSQSNLMVRKITRISDNTPVWGRTGRHEQILNRF